MSDTDKKKRKRRRAREEQVPAEAQTGMSFPTLDQLEMELDRVNYRSGFFRTFRSTIFTLITVAAIAILIAVLLLPVLRIYGKSMKGTLEGGDIVFSLKRSEPKTGEIIAFYYNNNILVKRVIATSGQWVDIDDNGNVYSIYKKRKLDSDGKNAVENLDTTMFGISRELQNTIYPGALLVADADMITDGRKNLSAFMGAIVETEPADIILRDGDCISFGKCSLRVISTPGHTRGGICLHGGGALFSGDTLFAGSIGRTDFPEGSLEEIIKSIQTRLAKVEDMVKVFPGHGPASNMGIERESNPYM